MTPPRVVLAPDKFKGSLTAAQVAEYAAAGLLRVRPDLEVVVVPVADGGDGTLAAAVAAGFERVELTASGPTGEPCTTAYGRRGEQAVVELAEISGLGQLPDGVLAGMTASSRGTGELIAAAVAAGCREVVIGIGGSACTDGGAGLVAALGGRLLGSDAQPVADGGLGLADAATLDLSGLHPELAAADLVIASDVDNPLTGSQGAAAVYGPQKGVALDEVAALDAALSHWADLVDEATGTDLRQAPGAGAAGGVGFALMAVLGAAARPGAEVVFELTGLRAALDGADLVITGEGSLDAQTLNGKAPAAVAAAGRAAGIPVVAVAGQVTLATEQLQAAGFSAAYALVDEATTEGESFSAPGPLLTSLGEKIAAAHLSVSP